MANLAGPECSVEDSDLRACPTCPYRGPKCGSRGRIDSQLVFVSEAPGHEEVRHHLPLVGPSGRVYWGSMPAQELLEEWGLPPEDFLILNSLQCLPPRVKKDAKKSTENIKRGAIECRPRLLQQIGEHPRKLIIAMGNHATWSLTGDYSTKITQIRGQLIPSPLAELGILPILHPAALLHGQGGYRQFKMDIEYGLDLMRGFPPKAPEDPYYLVCDTPEKVLRAVKRFIKKPNLTCDTETTGLNRFQDDILAIGICYDPRLVYIFPGAISSRERALELGAHQDWLNDAPSMIPRLLRLLKRYGGKFTWHNGKFDISFSRREEEGKHVRVDDDTMLMSYSLDENRGIHDLEQVAGDLLGAPDYKYMLKPWCPRKKDSYCKAPKKILFNYLALDVSNTDQIRPILRRRISEDKHLEKLYTRHLIPSSEELWHQEQRGLAVSEFAVKRQQKRLQLEIDEALEIVQVEAQRAGVNDYVNPGSPQQMASLLYDRLKLVPPPGSGRSTNKDILEVLPQVPVVKALRSHRAAVKSKGTYADTILENIEPFDGRVHQTYLIHGTRTGRLAHKIIANIPRDKRIRGMYCAAKGHVFIKADLDQAELRVLAALSGDPELCAIYRSSSRKLHREVSDDIWGKGNWNEDQYMRAKALNFGIIYGRQAESIADEFHIPISEAKGYINYWKKKFPVAWAFLERMKLAPVQGKTIITPFGRKKRHWIVTDETLNALQNEACNFPIQSIGSQDIVQAAANKVGPILRARGVYTVLQYHDEMIAECPDDLGLINWARNEISQALQQAPIDWGITRVPFKADTYVGKRWGIYRSIDKDGKWTEYLRSKIHLATNAEFEDVA